jgi:hypothetical protein
LHEYAKNPQVQQAAMIFRFELFLKRSYIMSMKENKNKTENSSLPAERRDYEPGN